MLKRSMYGFLLSGFLLFYLVLPLQAEAEMGGGIGCCYSHYLTSGTSSCSMTTSSGCPTMDVGVTWHANINEEKFCSLLCLPTNIKIQ